MACIAADALLDTAETRGTRGEGGSFGDRVHYPFADALHLARRNQRANLYLIEVGSPMVSCRTRSEKRSTSKAFRTS
jgi:hypothetical protein